MVFVGDDEDGNIHMSQADQVAQIMNDVDKDYIIKKIYLDAYQQEAASGVERYPQAADDILQVHTRRVIDTQLSGHGGELVGQRSVFWMCQQCRISQTLMLCRSFSQPHVNSRAMMTLNVHLLESWCS